MSTLSFSIKYEPGATTELTLPKDEKEYYTQQTWGELFDNRRIPLLFLALVTRKGDVTPTVYEGTRYYCKPLNDPTIEKVEYVFRYTFKLDNKGNIDDTPSSFAPIDTLPYWLQNGRNPYSTKNDLINFRPTLCEACNPQKPNAKAQFIMGFNILPDIHDDPSPKMTQITTATARTQRSDDSIRFFISAARNNHLHSTLMLSMIYNGAWNLLPTRKGKAERWIQRAIIHLEHHVHNSRPPTPHLRACWSPFKDS